MKKITNKKLSLSKETITSLTDEKMANAKGGWLTVILVTWMVSEIGNCSDKRGGCAPRH